MNKLSGLLYLFILCIVAGCFAGCSGRSTADVNEETEMAREFGHTQAMRLKFGIITDTIEIEKILIDVRVREQALRTRGEDKLADCYVESFLATLDSVNPPLRSLLQ